jgi:hypothetical protein
MEIANVTRDDKRGTGKRKELSKIAENQSGVERKKDIFRYLIETLGDEARTSFLAGFRRPIILKTIGYTVSTSSNKVDWGVKCDTIWSMCGGVVIN